jgi:hypothetical protein
MKMNSRFRQMFDAAADTLFRGRTAADVVATADSAVVNIDKLTGFWTDGNELADQLFPVIVNALKVDRTTGDETYKIDVVTNNGVVVGTAKITGVGQYVILVDADTLHLSDPTAASIKLTATLGGTTPILNYAAWLGEYVPALIAEANSQAP